MQVLIRVDASKVIGTGHVMRCLVLADRLSQAGATCLFVCRKFEGHLAQLIVARGHRSVLLETDADPPLDAGYDGAPPAHADWLVANWQQDAQATIAIAQELQNVDLAFVDHYALDHRWEKRLKPYAKRLLVLDDLADRRHCADVLVDQNYGHNKLHYAHLVTRSCRVLAGAQFALLRPQFAELRSQALARRQTVASDKHLLIFLGGGDTDRALSCVAKTLCEACPGNLGALTLVTAGASICDVVGRRLRSQFGGKIEVVSQTEDMARLMLKADLAIGGGGVTGWERCALGLPTLVLTMADNQRPINRRLAHDGHIFACVEPEDLNEDLIARFVDMDEGTYRTLSGNAATVTDGIGADRVMEALGYEVC